jgi:hypothetical protein
MLSDTALTSGFMVQMTLMRALPESDGCSMRVSLELRYGTWSLGLKNGEGCNKGEKAGTDVLPFAALSANVPMTEPKVSKL